MPSPEMLRRVALVRADVSEELMEVRNSSETSVLTRVTGRNIREDAILRGCLYLYMFDMFLYIVILSYYSPLFSV
jgi:hypothetical protein